MTKYTLMRHHPVDNIMVSNM